MTKEQFYKGKGGGGERTRRANHRKKAIHSAMDRNIKPVLGEGDERREMGLLKK